MAMSLNEGTDHNRSNLDCVTLVVVVVVVVVSDAQEEKERKKANRRIRRRHRTRGDKHNVKKVASSSHQFGQIDHNYRTNMYVFWNLPWLPNLVLIGHYYCLIMP